VAGDAEESAMPWTLDGCPAAMRRLPLDVRVKAIEIANAMLAEGYEEGQAIRMAIAAARKWARSHGGAQPVWRLRGWHLAGGSAAPPTRGTSR
jgi:hypothetical protein